MWKKSWYLLPLALGVFLWRFVLDPLAFPDPSLEAAGATPGDNFAATIGSAMQVHGEWMDRLNAAPTQAERERLFRDREKLEATSKPLLKLARSLGSTPLAVESLSWIIVRLPDSDTGREAASLLIERFATSPLVQPICARLAESRSDLAVEVLRQISERNPSPSVLLAARLALGQILKSRAEQVGWTNPSQAQLWRGEAELLFQICTVNHPSRAPSNSSSGAAGAGQSSAPLAQAQANLEEIQTLGVGQSAPDILGSNLSGGTMRLADFRGRVVALSFWGNWCSLCVAMFPHDRELVERMKGRPFAFLGVNSDEQPQSLRPLLDQGTITWRSWADGGAVRGGLIADQWNVRSLPTVFLIDARGVIRHKVGPRPDDHDTLYIEDRNGHIVNRWQSRADEINQVVEALVLEAEAELLQSSIYESLNSE